MLAERSRGNVLEINKYILFLILIKNHLIFLIKNDLHHSRSSNDRDVRAGTLINGNNAVCRRASMERDLVICATLGLDTRRGLKSSTWLIRVM